MSFSHDVFAAFLARNSLPSFALEASKDDGERRGSETRGEEGGRVRKRETHSC